MIKSSKQNVIAYLRVSTRSQEDNLSFDVQESKIQFYCNMNDLNIIDTIKEVASGGGMERDGIKSIISLVARRDSLPFRIDGIVVHTIDRLTRSLSDYKEMQELMFNSANNIRLHTVSGGGLVPPTSKVLIEKIKQSECELNMIKVRTKLALDLKRAMGQPLGRPRYGFKYCNGELVKVPHEQEVIGMAIKWRTSGYTLKRICLELAREGKTTRAGKVFSAGAMSRMLKDYLVGGSSSSGPAAYGYKKVDGMLLRVKSEQVVIDLIMTRLKLGPTYKEIADYLHDKGIIYRDGKTFSMFHIANVVRDQKARLNNVSEETLNQTRIDSPIKKDKAVATGDQMELF